MADTDRALEFTLNGDPVAVVAAPGESLLSVLRERLGVTSVKDGCAPQGQCGCCTVLIDGAARVACVTAAERVAGRAVTTVEGLAPGIRDGLAAALCTTGGSQCGFCTPGIIVRLAARGAADPVRGLAGHLCRCTGWQTIIEAVTLAAASPADHENAGPPRDLDAASARAALEGSVSQRVDPGVPLGAGGFADDTAPRDALVAVPDASGAWVLAPTLHEAREAAGKVQGRNTPAAGVPPLALPPLPKGGVRLATSWVEPGYLETDASWCEPGGVPATPLANGGAFGGKVASLVTDAAARLSEEHNRTVRVVMSREDTVRLGPKRPPIAASARFEKGQVLIEGTVVAPGAAFARPYTWPYRIDVGVEVSAVEVSGPPVSDAIRAAGWAEQVVLVEGALTAAAVDRASLAVDDAARAVLLDTCVRAPSGALAGASVEISSDGRPASVRVRVNAGDPLDPGVVRSYAIGAAHMGLGWVLSEGITVDPEDGEVLDLTIRSFGILRASETPPIEVEVMGTDGPPLERSSDAVFAAVAAATWNALALNSGRRPECFPAQPGGRVRATPLSA